MRPFAPDNLVSRARPPPESLVPISPLSQTGKVTQRDLDGFLKELATQPKDVAKAEIKRLVDAGDARLPDGAGSKLRDALWALQNDAWDPTQQGSTKRAAPAGLTTSSLERDPRQSYPVLNVQGKAEPGARIEVYNLSRGNAATQAIATGTVAADGTFAINGANQNIWFGEQIGVRVISTQGGHSDLALAMPKAFDVKQDAGGVWQKSEQRQVDRQQAPFVQANLIENQRQLATPADAAQHLVLTGKAWSVPPGAKLEVVIDNSAQAIAALPDGSFLFDVKGVKPGQQLELRVIEQGQVTVQRYNVPPLRFDSAKLSAANQGVPYDRVTGGKPSADGPFLRFAADAVADPGSTVAITNFTTGKSFTAIADKSGRVDLEISGVHTGDALGFTCTDPAGNVAQQQLEGFMVPGTPVEDPRLKQLLCSQTMLTAQVDETIKLLTDKPTAAHRSMVEAFVKHGAARVVQDGKDLARLTRALDAAFGEPNNVVCNAENPAPKDPIVIGARVIKPRIMDQGSAPNRDPLEVEGKSEPFARIEIRNASVQGAPVIGTTQADKNGNFKFVSRDESKFLHGDQLYVKATDLGGASSGSAISKTCAYELQIWTAQPREQLVELPHATDTRVPFIDQAKVKAERQPIAKNGKAQVFTFAGGAGSVEPNAILRVVTAKGETCEATSAKDGSFKLDVGNFMPGETLNLMVVDTNGQTTQVRQATKALIFDHAKLAGSSQGVPYERLDAGGKPDGKGPYLDFKAPSVVDPFSTVVVKNNSTGKTIEVQADESGSLGFTLAGIHAGDSLTFSAKDPAGNVAPQQLANYVVPNTANVGKAMLELECQHEYVAADVDRLIALSVSEPTAANRAMFESILAKPEAFEDGALKDKLAKAVAAAYAGDNNVRSNAENPAPKRPIVLDADIIKPIFMDAQPVAGRDPLEVRGQAEPYAWVEIKNASMQGFPQLTRVQADDKGQWKVSFRDESKFLHGDQLLIRAVDQGGAASKERLVTTCAYELRIWNNPPRTEKIKLDKGTDTRPPFLDTSKLTQGREPIAKDAKEQVFRFTGAPMASEPNAVVRVTNSKGEAYEGRVLRDGSFDVKVGNHKPGESLTVTILDGNGQVTNHRINTPALKFNPQAFIDTSEHAPFVRLTAADPGQQQQGTGTTREGPFLRFAQDAAVDPHSWVTITNNSTGEEFKAQADATGRLDVEIARVHTGDSLTFTCTDGAGNAAPQNVINWVVPGEARPTARVADICHQQTVQKAQIDELIGLLEKAPTAANRGVVAEFLAHGHASFDPATEKARLSKAAERIFSGVNDVVTDTTNPAPKEPIVLDARIIKPRVMDQGSVANRDPLEVFGTAEPFTWVEIRNASVPGAPPLGRVQTDANGEWRLTNRDESKFLHGDQLLIRAVDQGNAASKETLSQTCQYELRIWNSTNRSELVRLPEGTDTRPTFLDLSKVQNAQTLATKARPSTFTTLTGAALSAEPRSIIRVEGKNGVLSETKVNDDGTFKLEVGNYTPGETLKVIAFNAGGQLVTQNIRTEALRFNPDKLLADVDGPPFQKLTNGKPKEGGPFLAFKGDVAAFPGAILEVTNHSTGKVETFTADDKGSYAFELGAVHAFDLLTFKVKDAAGNEAPNTQRAWQVPAESRGLADPQVVALTSQRPVTEDVVKLLVDVVKAQPTAQHRMLVDNLVRQHPDWFLGGLPELQRAIKEIYKGPPEIVPDATNPAPKRPIILGAEIIKPRVMDQGNPPRDPLTVNGLGEPLAWIDIYNGSVPGRPLIGSVQVGEDGKFNFQSNDESKFLHGDQIVVMARDAGGAKSEAVVSKAKAFELRIWNSTNRREKVALTGAEADTRDPFLQANLVKTERAGGTVQQQQSDSFVLVGAAGATEVFGTVQVTIGANTFKVEADLDGGFRLPVQGLAPGTPVEIVAGDVNGRQFKTRYTPVIA